MKSNYDASQEFKPFANRGAGGQLIQEPTYKGHPNKKGYRKSAGKANTSRHAPNHRVRVSVNSDIRQGYHWERADGSKV
jgi:hypothetical protein